MDADSSENENLNQVFLPKNYLRLSAQLSAFICGSRFFFAPFAGRQPLQRVRPDGVAHQTQRGKPTAAVMRPAPIPLNVPGETKNHHAVT
ncbi:MAG: hypothetical protein A3E57_00845 [Candidatus Muproteobacteria bacterium RIFCSPHIGHO2_12_FULL_60_33]|uniref:Uncharacterized protein n=1 Tax=Candidatus Muproteobacteria bacterium RIFCSPLOWO2_01_FULL_60_18 TaxID=1817768 RepID=A0A1F6U1X1_9PROT|nr:MAG: hypothetical protein A3A87_04620 [Candidatus Muproteobacteria bacterium RIFCSPLOWO2_01_FULL_60_18]OGI53410.1 MAG: hypothetical protein A2W42_02850 [Candidatus Muproteobacteria bacterium RIFCSPHIGHO2_01_60_12]OGI55577.1 MAG: hypothetical protein A3E57_00845 [Candidatus Muproteobacteria bacterium RIFCSPHIGHO2_12_FULL_60_33]OGI60465.1 MAG: hypothetical protein A2809_02265 [Candidatus Muproteobacteria bacterium RIFCSPHIGHO2_01_FULL_61_200]